MTSGQVVSFFKLQMFVASIPCRGGSHFCRLSSSALYKSTSCSRRKSDVIRGVKDDAANSNAKRANLSASKKERIKIPYYGDSVGGKRYHISEFFDHPTAVEAILNAKAMAEFEPLGSSTYRCKLPTIHLLNFDVAPVMDLQVTASSEDCRVEMLSCKFEGSDTVERQNKNFSAYMTNYISWEQNDSESYMDVRVKLEIDLKIHTQPFVLLPVSAVEGPGNVVMQALLDRFVPLLVQQLLKDYESWVHQQRLDS